MMFPSVFCAAVPTILPSISSTFSDTAEIDRESPSTSVSLASRLSAFITREVSSSVVIVWSEATLIETLS